MPDDIVARHLDFDNSSTFEMIVPCKYFIKFKNMIFSFFMNQWCNLTLGWGGAQAPPNICLGL